MSNAREPEDSAFMRNDSHMIRDVIYSTSYVHVKIINAYGIMPENMLETLQWRV